MSSLTTPEPIAIRLQNVSKIYKLHGSQRDQLIDALGLQRFGLKTKTTAKEFMALSDISLDVPRGQRIGIIGRNGAGKTTLLKLISGNFAPTEGQVNVHGSIQALMNMGLGFHPEYTGRENVESSLQYNGLGRSDYRQAMEDIIEFCELDDFFNQPFRTYSQGMQARLMFAAATAVRPDILIVDEVLGAGDAYFIAKSKKRIEKLVESGCTMLLVSHSMQQVLELCNEAIWLDKGRISMQGDAFLVVKAYEENLYGTIERFKKPDVSAADTTESKVSDKFKENSQTRSQIRRNFFPSSIQLQEPCFSPHSEVLNIPDDVPPHEMKFITRGGISRWQSEPGLKVCGFTIVTDRGVTNELVTLTPAKIVIHLVCENTAEYSCRYGIVINDDMGKNVSVIYSPIDYFQIGPGNIRKIIVAFNPLQLGPGQYTVGISILEATALELVNDAKRYDLLGRSFEFTVRLPDTLGVIQSIMLHSAEWEFI